ncbi:hypothetical protein [Propionibacterium freudenreichii]|uniref:hypothetical protein n=1 Tax=Propionibacterium freudenreichii TaxID=1744 RepID=UPI0025518DD5|nr:hypothetical protein [Propionibacterium freudenreichii]MDK9347954.1 hypothetical protein [Propionibacterium freudenreichii]
MSEPPTHDPRGDHEQDTGPDAPPVQGPPQGIDPYGDQPDVPDMATPPSPWQAPPPAATPPTALPDSNTIPVDYEGFKGQWTITKSTWDSTGLNLEVEVKGTSGSLGFSFFALDTDGGSNQYKASGALATGTVTAGGTTTGRVHFNKSHQTTLVILANSYGRQITALTVDA